MIKILTHHGSEAQMSSDQPGDTESVNLQIPKKCISTEVLLRCHVWDRLEKKEMVPKVSEANHLRP